VVEQALGLVPHLALAAGPEGEALALGA